MPATGIEATPADIQRLISESDLVTEMLRRIVAERKLMEARAEIEALKNGEPQQAETTIASEGS